MADTATPRKRLSVAEFLVWEERQKDKGELFDGIPQALACASRNHLTIQGNIFAALRSGLRGSPCKAFLSDLKTQAAEGVYYPDVTVDCGKAPGDSHLSATPTVVFEVLSRSTRCNDLRLKLPNYQATPSIQQIVYVESETQALTVWLRDGEGWRSMSLNLARRLTCRPSMQTCRSQKSTKTSISPPS